MQKTVVLGSIVAVTMVVGLMAGILLIRVIMRNKELEADRDKHLRVLRHLYFVMVAFCYRGGKR